MDKKSGFVPVECPPGCAYAMLDHGDRHCGYILLTEQSRGCDPGPGCKRYRRGHHHPSTPMRVRDPDRRRARVSQEPRPRNHPKPTWDTARGRELWQQGLSNSQLAAELGVCPATIQRRKTRYWKKGED